MARVALRLTDGQAVSKPFANGVILIPGENFTVSLRDGEGRPLMPTPNSPTRDLLDVAMAYYRGDEFVARADADDAWTRKLAIQVPVARPADWLQAQQTLSHAAAFLAGDELALSLTRFLGDKPWYTGTHRRGIPTGFNSVCLFSGGMDSLAGALALLKAGRRVLLVGHIGDNNTGGYQLRAFNDLKREFGEAVDMVRLSVRGQPRYETSHRSRSFLFLASAVFMATQAGVEDVVFPENGLLSLNLPLDESRTGSYSTRTAHPSFLASFQDLLRQLGIDDIRIRNPHAASTKAEVIAPSIADYRETFLTTTSCSSHGRPFAKTSVRGHIIDYCGHCMPCVQRTIAFHAVGIDGNPRVNFGRDLVQLHGSTPQKLANIFPMARLAAGLRDLTDSGIRTRILAHGHFDPSRAAQLAGIIPNGYTPWTRLIRQWVQEFDAFTGTLPAEAKRLLGIDGKT